MPCGRKSVDRAASKRFDSSPSCLNLPHSPGPARDCICHRSPIMKNTHRDQEIIMGIAMKLSDYLKANEVQFDLVRHSHSGSSMQTAKSIRRASRARGQGGRARRRPPCRHGRAAGIEAPGNARIARARSGPDLRLATETKLKYLFKDCEPGAVPPLGGAYGIETIWTTASWSSPTPTSRRETMKRWCT